MGLKGTRGLVVLEVVVFWILDGGGGGGTICFRSPKSKPIIPFRILPKKLNLALSDDKVVAPPNSWEEARCRRCCRETISSSIYLFNNDEALKLDRKRLLSFGRSMSWHSSLQRRLVPSGICGRASKSDVSNNLMYTKATRNHQSLLDMVGNFLSFFFN